MGRHQGQLYRGHRPGGECGRHRIQDGASPEFHKIKMPGMQKFANITLKRGKFEKDNDFYVWWSTIQMNKIGGGT